MAFPKYFLISRKLLTERPELVLNSLRLFTVDTAVVACPEDAALAKIIAEEVVHFTKPVAIIADFDVPMQTINEDGAVEEFAPLDEIHHETPLIKRDN